MVFLLEKVFQKTCAKIKKVEMRAAVIAGLSFVVYYRLTSFETNIRIMNIEHRRCLLQDHVKIETDKGVFFSLRGDYWNKLIAHHSGNEGVQVHAKG